MTMLEGVSWIYWMLGTFGLAGTVAFFWFAPAVATAVFKFLATFLFTTRIGNIILTACVVFMIADINRSERDQMEFADKIAAMKEEQVEAGKQRDTEIREDTRAAVMAELARKRLSEAKLDSDVKEFTDALPTPPATTSATMPDFRVGDASCRLRAIAGYAGCSPEGAAGGVQKARSKGGRARLPDWAQYRLQGIISRGSGEPAQSQ